MSLYNLILCLLFYVLLHLAFLGIHKTSYYANYRKKEKFFFETTSNPTTKSKISLSAIQ